MPRTNPNMIILRGKSIFPTTGMMTTLGPHLMLIRFPDSEAQNITGILSISGEKRPEPTPSISVEPHRDEPPVADIHRTNTVIHLCLCVL